MAPEPPRGDSAAQMWGGLREILCIRFSAECLPHSECSLRTVAIISTVPHSPPWPPSWIQPQSYWIGLTPPLCWQHMLDDETCLIIELFLIFSLGVDATFLAAGGECARPWSFYSGCRRCILEMTFSNTSLPVLCLCFLGTENSLQIAKQLPF